MLQHLPQRALPDVEVRAPCQVPRRHLRRGGLIHARSPARLASTMLATTAIASAASFALVTAVAAGRSAAGDGAVVVVPALWLTCASQAGSPRRYSNASPWAGRPATGSPTARARSASYAAVRAARSIGGGAAMASSTVRCPAGSAAAAGLGVVRGRVRSRSEERRVGKECRSRL